MTGGVSHSKPYLNKTYFTNSFPGLRWILSIPAHSAAHSLKYWWDTPCTNPCTALKGVPCHNGQSNNFSRLPCCSEMAVICSHPRKLRGHQPAILQLVMASPYLYHLITCNIKCRSCYKGDFGVSKWFDQAFDSCNMDSASGALLAQFISQKLHKQHLSRQGSRIKDPKSRSKQDSTRGQPEKSNWQDLIRSQTKKLTEKYKCYVSFKMHWNFVKAKLHLPPFPDN